MILTPPTLPAPAAAPCAVQPPLDEAEIVAAAQRMQFGHGGAGASRLLRVLVDPDLSPQALAEHVGAEPAVAIRVLRVANSTYYGQSARVATLGRAGLVLGQQALRGVAMAACFDGISAQSRGLVHPDMTAFRRHSLATACAAQELARALAPGLIDLAFMAGLLHDLGMLLLWRLRPATLAATVGEAGGGCAPAGLGHADCGRVLMQVWSLPPALTQAVAEHEHIARSAPRRHIGGPDGPTLGVLLALAEALAGEAGFGLTGDAACALPVAGEPLHDACVAVAATFPAAAGRLLAALGQ